MQRRNLRRRALALVFAVAITACAHRDAPPPRQAMVAAADPRAVEAGLSMLAAGGSATDAAIATIAVLGLVEPQSAGVGGGGFLLAYDSARRAVAAYDGREQAPAAATARLFLGPDGKPLPYPQAIASGLSIGAPSLYAMLKLAHEDGGKLAWASLFRPAIDLAERGFAVSPRLSNWIAVMSVRGALKADPAARAYLFTPDGAPLPVGFVRKNPDYAASLRAIAEKGPAALSEGPIADAILRAAHAEPRPGALARADLKAVAPRKLEAVCGAFRAYRVCGAPPPSSGGIATLELLGLYAQARPRPEGPASARDWSAFLWASRLAYADRDYYLADDRFAPTPSKELLASAYLARRAAGIDLEKPAPAYVPPGDPGKGPWTDRWGLSGPIPESGTTHLSVLDADGDAVALTASIEAPFGAQRMAAGFFLNNQLTDFSRDPMLNGKPTANAPAAGKKPRSSMAPTLVFDRNGRLYAAIGSPGGSAIIAYVAKTIIGIVDWNLTMQAAIDLPNVVAAGPEPRLETDRFPAGAREALAARGWKLRESGGEASGLHGFRVTKAGLDGGADPRREGVARALTPPAAAAN